MSITSLIFKWRITEDKEIDKIFLEVFNRPRQKSFHAFLDCQTRVHHLPLYIHQPLSDYIISIYGLQTRQDNNTDYYEVLLQTTDNLGTLLTNGKLDSEDGIELTEPTNILPNLLPSDSRCCFTIDCIFPSTYQIINMSEAIRTVIIFHRLRPAKTFIFDYTVANGNHFVFPYQLQPATDYSIHILQAGESRCVNITTNMINFVGLLCSNVATFRSYMRREEINELYQKAERFVNAKQMPMVKIEHFYRNKSKTYYENILINRNGVMEKYKKNFGGDQASTLNRVLDGLFFSAHLDRMTLQPPTFSYYGPVRLHIPAHLLFNEQTNLYFADFYCHYENHKVMLVVTIKDSEADIFCRERLQKLDIHNNPFLKINSSYSQSLRFSFLYRVTFVCVTLAVTVEVFYTEDIDINRLRSYQHPNTSYFELVEQKGDSNIMIIGIPKNKNCELCNLDCVLNAR